VNHTARAHFSDRGNAPICPLSGVKLPEASRPQVLDRLQRLYIRHFRREVIRQQHYLEGGGHAGAV
jgi:hypothetical protein